MYTVNTEGDYMNILVMNGSPKGENGDTFKMTKAFLDGIKESFSKEEELSIEVVNTLKQAIKPCLGCYGCWFKTPGKCVQNDGMAEILAKIAKADLIIWSTPIYCYSFPANLKSVIDRMLPFSSPTQYTDSEGRTHHPGREKPRAAHMLITGSGFPDIKGNFDGLIFQFQRMFSTNAQMLICSESPLFSIKEAAPLTEPRLELFKQAGVQFVKNGRIGDEVIEAIKVPMLDPDEYRKSAGKQ